MALLCNECQRERESPRVKARGNAIEIKLHRGGLDALSRVAEVFFFFFLNEKGFGFFGRAGGMGCGGRFGCRCLSRVR